MLKIEDVVASYGGKIPEAIVTIKCYWDSNPGRDSNRLYKKYYDEVMGVSGGMPVSRVYVGHGLLEYAFLCKQFSNHVQVAKTAYKPGWCHSKLKIHRIEFDCCMAYATLGERGSLGSDVWDLYHIFIDVPAVMLNTVAQGKVSTARAYLVQSYNPYDRGYQFFTLPELNYPTNMKKFLKWIKESGKGFTEVPTSSLELWCKDGRDKKNLTTDKEIQDWLKAAKSKRFLEDKYNLPAKISIDYSNLLQPVDITQDDVDYYITEYNQKKRWEIKF